MGVRENAVDQTVRNLKFPDSIYSHTNDCQEQKASAE
jgi:hypothetical protein